MTQDPFYSYNPEEENLQPRKDNSKLFLGLIIGLTGRRNHWFYTGKSNLERTV